MKNLLLVLAVIAGTISIQSKSASAQRYLLKTGNIESMAVLEGARLTITQNGEEHVYTREPKIDSADGQYSGFYNAKLRKIIRFPLGGENSRIQIDSGYGTRWQWTQMTVNRLPDPTPEEKANERFHQRIDKWSTQIHRQANEIRKEVSLHYRSAEEYSNLIDDTNLLAEQSTYLHELAQNRRDIARIANEAGRLDTRFQQLLKTVNKLEPGNAKSSKAASNRFGFGVEPNEGKPKRNTNIRKLIESIEGNIQRIQTEVDLQNRVVVRKPAFGAFSDIPNLAARLEAKSNELLLDMNYNYSHNRHFESTYKEAYQLMTVSKSVRAAVTNRDRRQIQQQLTGIDELIRHLHGDIERWTRDSRKRIGNNNLNEKLQEVEGIARDLMFDAGVNASEETAPAPRKGSFSETAPPPGG